MVNCEKIIFERKGDGYYKVRLINIPITTDNGICLCDIEYPKVVCNIEDLVMKKGIGNLQKGSQNSSLEILPKDDKAAKPMFTIQVRN